MKAESYAAVSGCLYSTEIGWGAVVAGTAGVREVFLPFEVNSREELEARLEARYPGVKAALSVEDRVAREASSLLARYFAGERISFAALPLDLSPFTPFQREVYEVVSRIPYGSVLTYRQVAAMVGRPNAARGIGGAMGRNPLPVIIPCHRVVGSSGMMTGYSAPGGIVSKQWLLRREGVTLTPRGQIAATGVSAAKPSVSPL